MCGWLSVVMTASSNASRMVAASDRWPGSLPMTCGHHNKRARHQDHALVTHHLPRVRPRVACRTVQAACAPNRPWVSLFLLLQVLAPHDLYDIPAQMTCKGLPLPTLTATSMPLSTPRNTVPKPPEPRRSSSVRPDSSSSLGAGSGWWGG